MTTLEPIQSINNRIQENKQEVIGVVRRHWRSGKSYGAIAKYLNDKGYATKRGGKWGAQTVANVYQAKTAQRAKKVKVHFKPLLVMLFS